MSDDDLKVRWSKREKDILFSYPRREDGSLLYYYLGCEVPLYNIPLPGKPPFEMRKSFFKELEERGYDLTTLKFSIKKKKDPSSSNTGE